MTAGGWSAAALSVWGKSDRDSDAWMPLHRHLEDSAAVAGQLWDHWLSPSLRRAVARDLPDGEADGRVLLTWLASVHDIGKCTPAFAVKHLGLLERMHDAGLSCSARLTDARQVPHGMAGQVLLERWLQDRYGMPPRRAATYACVVGGHHGVYPMSTELRGAADRPQLLGERSWCQVQQELLDGMAARTGVDARLPDWAGVALPGTTQALLTALVIVADWLASDTTRFPYEDGGLPSAQRAERAWRHHGLPPMWTPGAPPRDPAEHLGQRFKGFTPRPVQSAVMAAAWEMSEPGVLVVEAPMGVGKTEAALCAAEVLAARFGLGGVFLALPTMATSDAMFYRALAWVKALEAAGGAATVHLAHGRAWLNDAFAGLARVDGVRAVYDDDDSAAETTVMTWLTGRKKGVLANFVVGTVDQVLVGALQSKHVVLRQLALASKVVVVDEVHAADDYMREYLARVMHWLGAMGTPVVLLSATLPPAQRRQLLEAYASGRAGAPPETAPPTTDYPLVTVLGGDRVTATAVANRDEPMRVEVARLDDADLVTALADALVDGGCAAVIRNTVQRAQDTAERLREIYGDDVLLVHSRFTALDRAAREGTLRRRLGPDATDRPWRWVVVGTQVLEQSLDIDFDLMVSDLAPIDLLLQRAGRLHRHARIDRPTGVRVPRLLVTDADWAASPPEPGRGSVAVYGRSRLLRAAAVLDGVLAVGELLLPDDIPRLVQAGYADTVTGPTEWVPAIQEADRVEGPKRSAQLKRARTHLVDLVPRRGGSLVPAARNAVDGDPDSGRAQVRDSEDGLEVVVVQRIDEVVRTMPRPDHGGREVSTVWPLEGSLAKEVAACTLRLPRSLTHPGIECRVLQELERNGFDGWQQSPWLKGQLVLVMDERMTARIAEHELQYDDRRGLTVTKGTT